MNQITINGVTYTYTGYFTDIKIVEPQVSISEGVEVIAEIIKRRVRCEK